MWTQAQQARYDTLRAGAGLLDLASRVRLRITGADRVKFLQGIFTNDAALLTPGRGLYGAILTAKGKMQADFTVYALPDWFWVDSEPEVAVKLPILLSRYTIGADAEVVDLSVTHGLLGLYGPAAAPTLRTAFPQLSVPGETLAVSEAAWDHHRLMIAESGLPGTTGYKILLPAAAIEGARQALVAAGASPGDAESLETLRIETGVPRFGVDMGEENFPPEARIDKRAISYSKGCYMGQETIARIKTYGHVNRLLVGLLPETDQPIVFGTKLYHPDVTSALREHREAGYVTSSVYSPALKRIIALGYVNRKIEAPGTVVSIGQDAPIQATVTALPFLVQSPVQG